MHKIAFIINPFSSKGNYQPLLEQLKNKIENPLVYISDSINGTDDFIKNNWENVEVFVAIGGDGTISTVAKSIINSDSFKATLEGMDGYDFSDIVSCGLDFQDRAIDDLRKITLNSSDRESIQAFIWMLKSL